MNDTHGAWGESRYEFDEQGDTMVSIKTTSPKGATAKSAQVKGGTFEPMDKNVNHPSRYTRGKIECVDALESAVVGKSPDEAIYVANIIKYLWRYEEKEPLRSLMSAEWYLKRLIEKAKTKYRE